MNTQDSMIVSVHTKAAINRLKEYLSKTTLKGAKVELKNDMLFIEFTEDTHPTAEFIETVRKIFYWTDQLSVPHIDGFVHYYDVTNALLVNLVRYEEICKICEKLKSFGAELKSFDISFHKYTFTYAVPHRSSLSYYELLEIEKIVDSSHAEDLKHISVFRMDENYSLTIKHGSWQC